MEGGEKLCNEQLHDLYFPSNPIIYYIAQSKEDEMQWGEEEYIQGFGV